MICLRLQLGGGDVELLCLSLLTGKTGLALAQSLASACLRPSSRSTKDDGMVILRIKCAKRRIFAGRFLSLRHHFKQRRAPAHLPALTQAPTNACSPLSQTPTPYTDRHAAPRKWCPPMPSPSSPLTAKGRLVYRSATAHATTLLHELARPSSARSSSSWGLRYVGMGCNEIGI